MFQTPCPKWKKFILGQLTEIPNGACTVGENKDGHRAEDKAGDEAGDIFFDMFNNTIFGKEILCPSPKPHLQPHLMSIKLYSSAPRGRKTVFFFFGYFQKGP